MPQLVPLLPSMGRAQRALVRTGFLAGDALRRLAGTSASTLPRSRRVDAQRAVELAPTVLRDGLDGGLLAYDGQLIDDARLVVAVARTAAQHDARILTRVAASDLTGTSARLTDTLTGESLDLTARAVINATGVWAGELDPSLQLRPSRGTHLVFDAAAFGNLVAALTIPIPGELNRFVFAMPEQLGRVYLGLTDEDAPGPIPDEPQPTDDEIDFLLDTVNTALGSKVSRADVLGSFAGLRPLIDTGAGKTADISRNHAVIDAPSGAISIVGGKLTEYRHMAEDVLTTPWPCAGWLPGRAARGTCRCWARPRTRGAHRVAADRAAVVAGGPLRSRGGEGDRVGDVRAPRGAGGRGDRRDPRGIRVRRHP